MHWAFLETTAMQKTNCHIVAVIFLLYYLYFLCLLSFVTFDFL